MSSRVNIVGYETSRVLRALKSKGFKLNKRSYFISSFLESFGVKRCSFSVNLDNGTACVKLYSVSNLTTHDINFILDNDTLVVKRENSNDYY